MRELIGGMTRQDIEKFIGELNSDPVAQNIKSLKAELDSNPQAQNIAQNIKFLKAQIEVIRVTSINAIPEKLCSDLAYQESLEPKIKVYLESLQPKMTADISCALCSLFAIKEPNTAELFDQLCLFTDSYCFNITTSYNPTYKVSRAPYLASFFSLEIPASINFNKLDPKLSHINYNSQIINDPIITVNDPIITVNDPFVSFMTIKLAVVFDNIDLVKHLWGKLMTQPGDLGDQLLFIAAELGSVETLDFLIKQGVSPFVRSSLIFELRRSISQMSVDRYYEDLKERQHFEESHSLLLGEPLKPLKHPPSTDYLPSSLLPLPSSITCNLLAIAIHGANNHVTDRQSTKETLRRLITQHQVDTDFVVTISRTEEKGYHTHRTRVPIETRYSLKQFDKTGVYTEVIEEIKHQKKRGKSPYAKKEPANAGASAASAATQPDVPSLLTRIARLEAENSALRGEIQQLKQSKFGIKNNKVPPKASAATASYTLGGRQCHFFNGTPGSCRNGQECRFDHAISIQKR